MELMNIITLGNIVNIITLGNIVFGEDNDMPQIEVMFNDMTVGYLAPFRHYCFQVSGTVDGAGDLGSSPIIQLEDVVDANSREASLVILKGLAMLALSRMARGFKSHIDLGGMMKVPAEDEETGEEWFTDKLEVYIDKVYRYLYQNS